MNQVSSSAPPGGRHNPWVGPREYRRDDELHELPDREREARELTDRIIAERVVLLYAPSAAGKTSLIEAAVVRQLAEEGFIPTPRLRVNLPPGQGAECNPYIHSLVNCLVPELDSLEPRTEMGLREAVRRWRAGQSAPGKTADDGRPTVLIIDQLEDILVIDPSDWDAKGRFFRELGDLLRNPEEPMWALLSIREDYMGGLDRYVRFLPGLLSARYRLDFLECSEAKVAMIIPAKEQHVDFDEQAATALVDKLRVVQIQRPGREPETVMTPYVEPVHLQVVCRQMWKKIRARRGDDFLTIGVDDVVNDADIDQALISYVGDTVASVVKKTGADEHKIRDWLESALITKNNLLDHSLSGPDIPEAENVLLLLEDGYIIRVYPRGRSSWYELTHDRLIRAVKTSNEMWRWDNLEPWQIAAHEWNIRDRHPAYLLSTEALPKGTRGSLTEVEKAFLKESEAKTSQLSVVTKMRTRLGLITIAAALEAIVIIALVIVLLL